MTGSAWRYGLLATFLHGVNAVTGQLLMPIVSVNLSRPRIANAFLGTQRIDFAGRVGDIYGRYIGYYFLNMVAWIVAARKEGIVRLIETKRAPAFMKSRRAYGTGRS